MTVHLLSVPIGTILDFAGANIPDGYKECNGQSLSRLDYDVLFQVLGGTNSPWGLPDSTHFNVPNLNGKVAIGVESTWQLSVGDSGGDVGETFTPSGTVGNHWLTNDEIPKHTHGVPNHTHTHNIGVNDKAAISIGSSGGHDHAVTVYYNTKKLANGTAQPLVTAGGASSTNNAAQIASDSGKHTHTVPQHGHTVTGGITSSGATTTNEQVSGGGAHNHGFTGTAAAISHMQPYAVVKKIIRAV